MDQKEISKLISNQKEFFQLGNTLPVEIRIDALQKLKSEIKQNEDLIAAALKDDLGKSAFSSYMCETGQVLEEIDFMTRHVKSYARDRRVHTPLSQIVGRSYVKPSPYGSVLIMAPWNYPVMLTLDPLVDCLAAGNTAVVKPSAYAPRSSEVIEMIISEVFEPEYVCTVTGGRKENAALMESDFDYIFFTGSVEVGKQVMEKAAKKLIPVTLELGGKSPCIVDKTADLRVAARRIVFGKYLNCGQTCVAPDYVYCDESVKDELIQCLEYEIVRQFGVNPLSDVNYGKIVNEKHFNRLMDLMDEDKVCYGGINDPSTLQIEPTIMEGVSWDSPVMKEEIFGPILPVLEYRSIFDVIEKLQKMPSPLALYLFSKDPETVDLVTSTLQFGGGCINDTIIQLATSEMGFGGVGQSGMGQYHGKAGFDTFTHYKSIVHKVNWPDFPFRYQPYTKAKEFFVKLFLK